MTEVVARADELRALGEFLDGPVDSAGALVLEGEAGVGKTTLFRAALELAAERSLRVLSTSPARAERQLANAGLGDLLDGVLDEVLPMLIPPRRRALELALLRTEPHGRPPDTRAIGVAVQAVLRSLTAGGAVVLAIDDEQWLDASSAAVLDFALRRLLDRPIAILLSRRTGEHGPRLESVLPFERVERLGVEPLSLGATHALLRQHLGRSFARPTMLRIHATSDGNPFFALELARAFARSAEDGLVPLPVPDTLEAAVRDRLAALPRRSRPVLLAASALASPTIALLNAGWSQASHVLEGAERAGVITVDEDEVHFSHPLFASVLYDQATVLERRRVHAKLATLVDDPLEHARHLALARSGLDAETAGTLETAALHARARGAPLAAAELGELALRKTPPRAAEDRRRRTFLAARDHLSAGDLRRARELADGLVVSSEVGRGLAEAVFLQVEIEDAGGTRQRAIGFLEAALEASRGLPDLEAAAHAQLAVYLRFTAGTTAASDHARTAVALAERLDDTALRSKALSALALTRFLCGEPDAFELGEQALELARTSGEHSAVELAMFVCVENALWAGELRHARQLLDEQYEAGRDVTQETTCLWYLSLVELRAGNWTLAREHVERARELYAMLDEEGEVEAMFPLASIAAHRGDEVEAVAYAERGRRLLALQGDSLLAAGLNAIVGQVEFWAGDPASATQRFEQARVARERVGYRDPGRAWYEADHVEALLELGRVDDAIAILEPWAAAAERLDRWWALAQVTRCRGLVAASHGAFAEAVTLLLEAVERHALVGDPFGRARALYGLGQVRRRAGERRLARETFGEALRGFEALGAARWIQRTQAELAQIGGRVREDGLTPSEVRVAELVTRGRTNREVAAALFLSEKTVESHLSHIYAKLEVRSRTELARDFADARG